MPINQELDYLTFHEEQHVICHIFLEFHADGRQKQVFHDLINDVL
jgi:hypothetical protein